MTTEPTRRESRMLDLVRAWRRAALETEPRTEQERRARDAELIRRFGLQPEADGAEPRRAAG